MKKEAENHLRRVLKRLEEGSKKILSTRGYCVDVARIRLLEELIKEQFTNEDTRTSARTVR